MPTVPITRDSVVKLPKEIKDIARIGFTDYNMGLGSLHSKEKKRSYISDDSIVIDHDAAIIQH
jgi:hypothetical protein